ncbi:MAG: hypothetical protein R3Y09_08155 [Clostridia bacterium]
MKKKSKNKLILKAFLTLAMSTLLMGTALADYSGTGVTELTSVSSPLAEGSYYLTGDLETETSITISSTVSIDLNGYDIKYTGDSTGNVSVITVNSGGNLTILDSKVEGDTATTRYGYWSGDTYTVTTDSTEPTFSDGTVVTTITGGMITGGTGAIITYNTNVQGNAGGGVYVDVGTLNLKGGNIVGNSGAVGGGVCVNNGGTITMSDDAKL